MATGEPRSASDAWCTAVSELCQCLSQVVRTLGCSPAFGHRRLSTTNRYVPLNDTILGQAAERVALAVQSGFCHHEPMLM